MKQLSLVLPIYNEEATLPILRKRLTDVTDQLREQRGLEVETILVDDGSRDASPLFLANWAAQDETVKVLTFSRNFGHQAALTAGMDAACGDCLIMMDADLQDPPEVIPQLLDKHQEGYDVVYARRASRAGESLLKRGTAWLFYRLMKGFVHRDLPQDTGDFRLLSGKALETLTRMREKHRFLRGLSTWIGFRQTEVVYARAARAGGQSKFSPLKMCRFAWDAAISFSTLPMKLVTIWGTCVSLFGLVYLIYTVYRYFVFRDTVPGWATLIVLLCVIGGSILVGLGIIGSYIGKMFEELKERPLYIVQSTTNCNDGVSIGHQRRGERVDIPRYVGVDHQA